MQRAVLIALAAGLPIAAASANAGAGDVAPVLMSAAEVKWGDAPPAFPRGAKMAVLYGDPGKPGLFVVRMKLPAGYAVQAHWHSTDEIVSVVSGSASFGMGDKLDRARLHSVAAGSFIVAPAKHNHFATTKSGAVLQVSAVGPFDITYVDPKDDPRNRPQATK